MANSMVQCILIAAAAIASAPHMAFGVSVEDRSNPWVLTPSDPHYSDYSYNKVKYNPTASNNDINNNIKSIMADIASYKPAQPVAQVAPQVVQGVTPAVQTSTATGTAGASLSGAASTHAGGDCNACPNGALVSGRCYTNLADALKHTSYNTPVIVQGTLKVKDEITLRDDVQIIGHACNGQKPRIDSYVDEKYDAIFYMDGQSGQSVRIENIDFKNREKYSRMLRSKEYNDDEEDATDSRLTHSAQYNLDVVNVKAEGFKTKARGGSAIFIQSAKKVNIVDSEFLDNNVADPGKEYYGGGGAVWVQEIHEGNSAKLANCHFEGNSMDFEHGLGGGAMFGINEGLVEVSKCTFRKNKAADGGAIHVARTGEHGTTNIHGLFESNEAVEKGWGSRGAALRFKYIAGHVNIDGEYYNNEADGGWSLIANNDIDRSGHVTLAGTYKNNSCKAGGAIFDTRVKYNGFFTIKAGTVFEHDTTELKGHPAIWLHGYRKGVPNQKRTLSEINRPSSDYIIKHEYV